jgi:hypothetical protein
MRMMNEMEAFENRDLRICPECKRFFGIGKLWHLDLCTTNEFNFHKACNDDV